MQHGFVFMAFESCGVDDSVKQGFEIRSVGTLFSCRQRAEFLEEGVKITSGLVAEQITEFVADAAQETFRRRGGKSLDFFLEDGEGVISVVVVQCNDMVVCSGFVADDVDKSQNAGFALVDEHVQQLIRAGLA